VQLHRQKDDFERLRSRVLLISFGPPDRIPSWKQETQISFPVLFDPDRLVYKAYETERSYRRSWGVNTLIRYGKLLISGRKWRGIQGDSAQLGGSFIIDTQGMIQMSHYSQDPTDRPEVDDLITYLQEIRNLEN
jgi:peroxiredoxin